MKNIHILPTDKPSRLIKIKDNLFYTTTENISSAIYQNIYITSDEEIKAGEYQLYNPLGNFDNVKVSKAERLLQNDGRRKKIILTTDQDLIKDGVQAIDDEFLEWFVKNPSCERVEVKDVYKTFLEGDKRSVSNFRNKYKIIISKGEPKFITVNIESAIGEDLGKVSYIPLPNVDYIPKQETPEEAAEKYDENDPNDEYGKSYRAFIEGAKWQQERMYSEEEVKNLIKIIEWYDKESDVRPNYTPDIEERIGEISMWDWFEQFKKK